MDLESHSATQRGPEAPSRLVTLRNSLALLALLYALLAGLKTVVDFDLGWQMATGRYLLTRHAIPRTELFSYTAHGVEWIYPILSGTIFFLLHQLGGYAAISWLCALSTVACAAVLLYRRSLPAVALTVLAVPVLASETMPRASLFTLLLFTAFARILLDYYESRRAPLWLLPLLMLLWVNLHPGFIAGLALLIAYLLVETLDLPFAARRAAALTRLRRALPWLAATFAATLLNPWGIRIYTAVARQQAVTRWQSVFLEEWQPVQLASALQELNWRSPDSARWYLLAFGLLAALAFLWKRRLGPALVLLAAAAAFLQHQRMEGPAIVLIVLLGGSLLTHAAALPRLAVLRRQAAIATAFLLTLLVAGRSADLVTDRAYVASAEITLFGAGPSWWLPTHAADFLLAHHLPGNVFAPFNLGSYLVWKLNPTYPDFADGRYVPFGEPLIERQRVLTGLPLDSSDWTQAAAAYHIDTVIFPLSRLFALGDFPLRADCASKLWTPVYMDTAAVIFTRNGAASNPQLPAISCDTQNLLPPAGSLTRSYRERAERYQVLANASAIYSQLGRYTDAQQAADLASDLEPDDPTLHFLRAQTALGLQQYDLSEAELLAALKLRQTDAGWYNLALLYIGEHRYPGAIAALQKSARLSRENYARHLLIARILLAEQEPQQALDALTQATRTSPYGSQNTPIAAEFNAAIADQQAAAYLQLQQPGRAVDLERHAVELTPANTHRRELLTQYCQAAKTACPMP